MDPVSLTKELCRFATVNPPGDEAPCVEYIAHILSRHGLSHETYSFAPGPPSLVLVPGAPSQAHKRHEYRLIPRILESVTIYEKIMAQWCYG